MKYKNISTADYMARLTEKVESKIKFARENTAKAQVTTKRTYDQTLSHRQLKPGQLDLILMPRPETRFTRLGEGQS